jgi:hypothetical protein
MSSSWAWRCKLSLQCSLKPLPTNSVMDAMDAIIDDLLAELEPDDCNMIADFCADWARAFDSLL